MENVKANWNTNQYKKQSEKHKLPNPYAIFEEHKKKINVAWNTEPTKKTSTTHQLNNPITTYHNHLKYLERQK